MPVDYVPARRASTDAALRPDRRRLSGHGSHRLREAHGGTAHAAVLVALAMQTMPIAMLVITGKLAAHIGRAVDGSPTAATAGSAQGGTEARP